MTTEVTARAPARAEPDGTRRWHLLTTRELRVEAAPGIAAIVGRWVPRVPADRPTPGAPAARMRVDAMPALLQAPDAPDFVIGEVHGWTDARDGHVRLAAADGGCDATLDAAGGEALVRVDAARDGARHEVGVHSVLAVAAAMLVLRLGGHLAHAGAIVAPDGGAWLLVGDSHAGKTTTCLNLIRAGWDYLSDDNVVLCVDRDAGHVLVEGWPRLFHVDTGWTAGTPHGRRERFDPSALGPGRWRRTAPLAGLLFPRVEASASTALSAMRPADALAGLIRQSPWVLADRARAPHTLADLSFVAAFPAYALRLGLDSYGDPDRLVEALRPVALGE